ncbi:hypothetical protein ABPG72_017943 [Tetrahymena utriculariae]
MKFQDFEKDTCIKNVTGMLYDQESNSIYNLNDNLRLKNLYLHKLIQHSRYGKTFEFYLTFEAEYWLEKNKVKQKQDHQILKNFSKLCCCYTDYSNCLIAYQKGKKNVFNYKQ